MRTRLLQAALFLLFALGCGSGEGVHPDPTLGTAAAKNDTQIFARDANDFSLAFYRRVRVKGENLCLSPHSVRTCLAMVYAGARNRTEAQMKKVLRFNLTQEKLHQAAKNATAALQAENREVFTFQSHNALWKRKDRPFLKSYIDVVKTCYDAPVLDVDFTNASEAARTINGWVSERTRNRIPTLIEPEHIDPLYTVAVLVNTVYLKGLWTYPFYEEGTEPDTFHPEVGSNVEVPFMHMELDHDYWRGDGVQVLRKSLDGSNVSAYFLLPTSRNGLASLETRLTPATLSTWVSSVRSRPVKVFLPKFSISTSVDLEPVLQTMGMVDAFIFPAADFSGMNDDKPLSLFISFAIHKAFVEVNEDGVEAAGGSGVGMSEGEEEDDPKKPAVFRADHPFLFLIRHNTTGVILFLGRVANPLHD